MDVLSALSTARLVPVVVLDDAADADELAGALVSGGLPVAEVTFRTAAAADSPFPVWLPLPRSRPHLSWA